MSTTMRAVAIHNDAGPISALHIADVSKPTAKSGEALVRIKAFGLNRMDLLQREGQYPVPPGVSKILGVEFSGTIEDVHDEKHPSAKDTFSPGDEVFGLAYGGAYAEFIAVSTSMLMHKPKELSWEVAAGIPETWITAAQALWTVGGWSPGKSVLWHAGASAVSIAGLQMCSAERAEAREKDGGKGGSDGIYVTASTEEKIEFCKTLGADQGFNYKKGKWDEELLAATDGRGVDLIIDFIGAGYFAQNLNGVARDGRIVNLGFLGGTKLPAETDIGAFVRKRVRYEGSALRSRDPEYQRQLRDLIVDHALPRIVDGRFNVPIEKVFSWKEIQDAHKLMETNQTKGKIICLVD